MENKEIARLLAETADLMEIAGGGPLPHPELPQRSLRHREPSRAHRGHPQGPRAQRHRDPRHRQGSRRRSGRDRRQRGSFERRDQLLEKYPPTAFEFLKIQGLGPKSIALIWEHYRVSTIDDLERLCLEQKLRELPRMGAKLEEKVLRSIAHYRKSAGRFLLSFADEAAGELVEYLAAGPGIDRVTPAGSLRRGKETVGDLDLLVTGPQAPRRAGPLRVSPQGDRSAGEGRQQGQRQGGGRRSAGGRARPARGELRRRPAVLHRQQRAQRRAADALR